MREKNITLDTIKMMTEEQLVIEIEKHNELYWNKNNPVISDEEYDILVERLKELNPNNPILHKVEIPNLYSEGNITLNEPMISLDKTYFFKVSPKGKKSLMDWMNDNKRSDDEEYLIQPKYDGISALFTKGMLITKGNYNNGENISSKIPIIKLKTLNYCGLLSSFNLQDNIRGEIILDNNDFKSIREKLYTTDGNKYKNVRNAVSGILSLKNIDEILKKNIFLTLIDYDFLSWKIKFSDFENSWDIFINKIMHLPYPIDGVVIKISDLSYSQSLGSTAHHPRGQIAFKFTGNVKKSKLIDVIWSLGKNRLTPVAKIEPIEINGVMISHISLHNINIIEKLDIMIGDILTIERAGDVIPHVVDVEHGLQRKSFIIDRCPFCKSILERDDKLIRCTNNNCFETNLKKILYSIRSFGIKEIGKNNLKKIIETLKLEKFIDIFEISKSDLLKIDGFKEKMSENIYNNIWKRKQIEDYKLLASLNIEYVGLNISKKILEDYRLNQIIEMDVYRLGAIPSIGIEIANYLYNGLRTKKYEIEYLYRKFNIINTKISSINKLLFYIDRVSLKSNNRLNYCINILKLNNYAQIKLIQFDDKNMYLPNETRVVISDNKKFNYKKIKNENNQCDYEVLSIDECINKFTSVKSNIDKMIICFTGNFDKGKSFYHNVAVNNGNIITDTINKNVNLLVVGKLSHKSNKLLFAEKYNIKITSVNDWIKNQNN